MKVKYLAIGLLTAFTAYGCDDTSEGVGKMIYDTDKIETGGAVYEATSKTIQVDSVYSRSTNAYLGKYTDPVYGVFTADFIAQINCPEGFEFPATMQSIDNIHLNLLYSTYFGDSLSTMTLAVDTLNTAIQDNGTDKGLYYTTFKPENYYNTTASPIATQSFSAVDHSVSDSIRALSAFQPNVSIPLGQNFATYVFNKYQADKNNFKDAYSFINNVLKGFYVHTTQGEGAVLNILDIQFNMTVSYLTTRPSTKVVDSLVSQNIIFPATPEVFTSTRFNNGGQLSQLAADNSATYLKTPAGLFTEITLPIEQMYQAHKNDTLNSLSFTLTKYNETETSGAFTLDAPSTLLLVRKKDMYSFFEQNKVYDNNTSFTASFVSASNSYAFTSLNRLLRAIFKEREAAGSLPADADKVVLIPVVVTTRTDTRTNRVIPTNVAHNLNMSSARLIGGQDKISINLIYSRP